MSIPRPHPFVILLVLSALARPSPLIADGAITTQVAVTLPDAAGPHSAAQPGTKLGRTSSDRGARQGGGVRLEYIAHASFRVVSPGGTSIVLDPFNGNIWLGYSFPIGIEADAILVSHPHYDHDATYYFDDLTPVFRRPGAYRIGDVELRGIESEHAGRARFLDAGEAPLNTIWVLETGGLRIAHLGDNRLPNEIDLEAIGSVDVMLVNAAFFDRPNLDMLTMLLETLEPDIMVPMHYRHEGLSELPASLGTVADYMGSYERRHLDDSVVELDAADLDAWPGLLVLPPSPAVVPWPDHLYDAWVEANEGAGMLADAEVERDAARAEEALWEGLFHYEAAMDLAPEVLRFGYGAGRALAFLGRINDAIETLDHAVARAPRADWTDRARVHMLLGELYEQGEHPEIAIEHYEYVAAQEHTHETPMRQRALQKLQELRQRP